MRCTRKITDDLTWVGANDRRLAMFEGVYSVPCGVSYNSYLLTDEKTVLFDTSDKAVSRRFMENVASALGGRALDYLVIQHMEPDHSAALAELAALHPEMRIVCNSKTLALIKQFYGFDMEARSLVVKEGDELVTGRHSLRFIMAPMVHWPEVMATYDATDKVLFSADAFGCFGALNGALFADEVDFAKDYMDEARRYYANIVGKYGTQVQSLLGKASALEINMICPLHGFVWRKNLGYFTSKYDLWSRYEPEERGVMIAYASIYGNTENAAEMVACRLRERGVKTEMFDVSVTPASDIIAAAFKWSHLVLASATYNTGIFVTMEALLNDLTAHNIQNREVAVIENGSWAPASGGLIKEKLAKCRNITFIGDTVTVKSGVKEEQLAQIEALADSLADSLPPPPAEAPAAASTSAPAKPPVDMKALFKISYGLFALTAREGGKDNGCIINTVSQLTENPLRVSVTVNKSNLTHDMILKTGLFNVSVLTEEAPFKVFEIFGFRSGRETDKFAGCEREYRSANGLLYLPKYTNAVLCGRVVETLDEGTHTLFIAELTQAFILPGAPSLTYQYYFDHIKPKPAPRGDRKKGFVCKICGYVYEGDTLPEDFICPVCKHGASDFEPL